MSVTIRNHRYLLANHKTKSPKHTASSFVSAVISTFAMNTTTTTLKLVPSREQFQVIPCRYSVGTDFTA